MVRRTGEDLINAEGIAIAPALSFQAAGVNSSEPDAPEADSFWTDSDSSLGQTIFDITVAEIEAIAEPGSVADELGWEPVPFVRVHPPILSIFPG